MNYIQEINAIHRDFEISGLSPKARLLWLVLLDLNNRQHWPRSFQAPAAFLMNQCGFSAKSLQRAREELTAAGRLGYQPGASGRLGRSGGSCKPRRKRLMKLKERSCRRLTEKSRNFIMKTT